MTTYLNRWTIMLGWMVLLSIVWTLFVPGSISVTTFVLFGMIGLIAAFFGSALVRDSQPPRSVNAILGDLEAEGAAASKPRRTI